VNTLLQSSPVSWLRTDTNIQPNFGLYPEVGFARQEPAKSYPLAVSVQGVFESYFTDRPSPLLQQDESEAVEGTEVEQTAPAQVGTIKTSPESARLVVIGSAEFLDDVVLQLSSSGMGERYLNSLQFLQNAVDWSVEDLDLLEIRSRGTQVRVLKPMNEGEQRMWEAGNYAAALLSVLGVGMIWNARRQHEVPIELVRGESGGAAEKNAAERGTEEQT
jgi:ABC-2 type transport system permease protein